MLLLNKSAFALCFMVVPTITTLFIQCQEDKNEFNTKKQQPFKISPTKFKKLKLLIQSHDPLYVQSCIACQWAY